MCRCSPLAVVLLLAIPGAASAQFGVAAHVGSLGLGADVGIGLSKSFGIRLGANVQPWALNATVSEVAVSGRPASPSFTGFLDLHPGGTGFRLTGGAVLFAGSHNLRGQPTGTVDFGGLTWDAAMVGTVTGTLETRSLAPYGGIGWGGATRSGFGLSVDLGVAMHGTPRVSLDVDGLLALDPTFMEALEREVAEFEDEAAAFSFYPVLSIGLSMAAGR